MIKAWLFALPYYHGNARQQYEPAVAADTFDWYLQSWIEAEAQGFEGIFFSEHHVPHHSLAPVPNLLMAAVAAQTRRLRLGVLAHTMPMHDPWRLAEECAVLDNLMHGRLEIGVARGAAAHEQEAVGLAASDMQARFVEGLDVLERCFGEDDVHHDGRFWKLDGFTLMPKLYQRPAPPFWIPVMTPDSCAFAARRGHKVCGSFHTVERLAEMYDAYRAAAATAGKPAGPECLGIRRNVLICESETQAAEMAEMHRDSLLAMFEMLAKMVTPDEFIFGTARTVTEKIVHQCRTTGAGHIVVTTFESLTREQIADSNRRFATEVIPALGKVDLKAREAV